MSRIKAIPVRTSVKLVEYPSDPLRELYNAYRTCYSTQDPKDITSQVIENLDITQFVERRMKTEHTSPLEFISFTFAISNVSKTMTHQLVRHRVGISFAQQSGRYTDPTESGVFKYVLPYHVTDEQRARIQHSVDESVAAYQDMLNSGLDKEDARILLPQCLASNIMVKINFAALLHMADIRLCLMTQWEFRRVVAMMKNELNKNIPEIGKYLQPKCHSSRRGVCDEDITSYQRCGLRNTVPHKFDNGGN